MLPAKILAFVRPYWRALRPKIDFQSRYETQFKEHRWDHLEGLEELSRYSVIFGYCQYFDVKDILDVGCGQGVLASKLKVLPYEAYMGVDFSSHAIVAARQKHGDARTSFEVADASQFMPQRQFDVIIYNCVLSYLDDPYSVVQAHARALKPSGFMVVCDEDTVRKRSTWALIEKDVAVEDEVRIINRANTRWITKRLSPPRR